MTLADRLRNERLAKGLSQAALASACGVQSNAQGKYEKGLRLPRADYFCALSALDIDVHYVLTGVRSPLGEAQLSPPEAAFIRHLRSIPPEHRKTVQDLLGFLAQIEVDGQ